MASPQAWRLNPVIENHAETAKSLFDGLQYTLTMRRRGRMLPGNDDSKSLGGRLTSTLGEAHLLDQEQLTGEIPEPIHDFRPDAFVWGFPYQKSTRERDAANLHS